MMETMMQTGRGGLARRDFLRWAGMGAMGVALAGRPSGTGGSAWAAEEEGAAPGAKSAGKLRGLMPIASTPFTADDKLDLECLANEIKFCNKGEVHGLAWPQIASGWTSLKEEERLAGAEALAAANKGGKTWLVIGVQSQDKNMATVERYAKHAAKSGANALVSLPPTGVSDEKALLTYYQAVGKMTDLPLFVQTQAEMSVNLLVEIYKTVPTARYVKDEATAGGGALKRIAEIRRRTK